VLGTESVDKVGNHMHTVCWVWEAVDMRKGDVPSCCRSLVSAIGDAEAVICAVGAASAFDGKAFDEVDRKVHHPL
jgi:hypothetical protein